MLTTQTAWTPQMGSNTARPPLHRARILRELALQAAQLPTNPPATLPSPTLASAWCPARVQFGQTGGSLAGIHRAFAGATTAEEAACPPARAVAPRPSGKEFLAAFRANFTLD